MTILMIMLTGKWKKSMQKAQFAIVLDGLTIMASGFNPSVVSPITDGRVQITGGFTQAQAKTLANQLSFGSLPLTFIVQSEQQISATLGTEQLRNDSSPDSSASCSSSPTSCGSTGAWPWSP